jgi:hypothetical protein
MDTTITDAIAFLEAQGWTPRRLAAAWSRYQAQPTRANEQDAITAMHAVLRGFIITMEGAIFVMMQAGGSVRMARINELRALQAEARALMSGQLPASGVTPAA